MIFEKTRDIMLKGINKYAKLFGAQTNQIQIKINAFEDGNLTYTICQEWQPKEEITFLQIMDRKIDLLGYEMLSTPFMHKSLVKYSKDHESELENVSAFLSKYKESVALSVFVNTDCVRSLTLERHFAEMGM